MENKKIYICPMHPEIKEPEPGHCPECGMNLVPERKEERTDKHTGHSTSMFLRKFWVSLALTVPVVLYSEIPEKIFGWRAPAFPGSQSILLILGSIVFFYGGWVFLTGAWREMHGRLPGMMTLIAIAITAAYAWSVWASFAEAGRHTLFWELTTLITIMLLGHYLEMKSVQSAQGALKELSKLMPDTAELILEGSKTKTITISDLREGDLIFVRPGSRIPADGIVADGRSETDESMVSGESRPVRKTAGAPVVAGTINGDGSLKIRVSKVGERTFLAGIIRLVKEAQSSKSRLQILSDRAALYLTAVAVLSGAVTLVAWLFSGSGFSFAVARVVAVLVIACPHALGLAVPLVASISTTLAAKHGFLVKQRIALEAARRADVILFDKTGTLTKGEYGVAEIIPSSKLQVQSSEVLRLAASVDSHSEHFISKAIVRTAEEKELQLDDVKNFERLPGKGVKGVVNGKVIAVGGEKMLDELKAEAPDDMQSKVKELAIEGKTVVYVISDANLVGAIALSDIIREESREAVSDLKAMGVRTAMVTGDSDDVAKWVAKELDIDQYFARVLPGEKADIVKQLQENRFKNWKLKIGDSSRRLAVMMVGDGINDAPALTQADVGIAIGAGTNVAIESAGIILVRNDPRDIVRIINLSRLTYRKMIENLFWASGYNIVALPLAAGALASYGIILEPAVSALFMSLSTVIVAVNAILLKRKTI